LITASVWLGRSHASSRRTVRVATVAIMASPFIAAMLIALANQGSSSGIVMISCAVVALILGNMIGSRIALLCITRVSQTGHVIRWTTALLAGVILAAIGSGCVALVAVEYIDHAFRLGIGGGDMFPGLGYALTAMSPALDLQSWLVVLVFSCALIVTVLNAIV